VMVMVSTAITPVPTSKSTSHVSFPFHFDLTHIIFHSVHRETTRLR
jgi:hypothetical protein